MGDVDQFRLEWPVFHDGKVAELSSKPNLIIYHFGGVAQFG